MLVSNNFENLIKISNYVKLITILTPVINCI